VVPHVRRLPRDHHAVENRVHGEMRLTSSPTTQRRLYAAHSAAVPIATPCTDALSGSQLPH
jgi:hypothetical protein